MQLGHIHISNWHLLHKCLNPEEEEEGEEEVQGLDQPEGKTLMSLTSRKAKAATTHIVNVIDVTLTHTQSLSVSMARTGANNKCIRKLTYKFMNDIVNVMSTST